jgi:hypothetical protein
MDIADVLFVETSIFNYNSVTSSTGVSISSCVVLVAQRKCNLSCIQIEFNLHDSWISQGCPTPLLKIDI